MKFEFDDNKSRADAEKHGINLEEASQLWEDPNLIIGPATSIVEERWAAVGKIGNKYWLVVFTWRGNVVRLIACRKARVEEIESYEASK